MSTKSESTRMSLVRAIAAYDRESDEHKKIYEDLAEE